MVGAAHACGPFLRARRPCTWRCRLWASVAAMWSCVRRSRLPPVPMRSLTKSTEPVFLDADPATWDLDPNLLEKELRAAAQSGRLPRPSSRWTCTVSAPTTIALDRCASVTASRSSRMRPSLSAPPTGAGRPARWASWACSRSMATRSSRPPAAACWLARIERWSRPGPFLSHASANPAPHYQHSEIGFNYRLSDLLAAVGRGDRVLADRVAARRAPRRLPAALGDLPGLTFMPYAPYGEPNGWLTCVTINPDEFGATHEDVRLAVEPQNIEPPPGLEAAAHAAGLRRLSRPRRPRGRAASRMASACPVARPWTNTTRTGSAPSFAGKRRHRHPSRVLARPCQVMFVRRTGAVLYAMRTSVWPGVGRADRPGRWRSQAQASAKACGPADAVAELPLGCRRISRNATEPVPFVERTAAHKGSVWRPRTTASRLASYRISCHLLACTVGRGRL